MRDKNHYLSMLDANPSATVGLLLAARAVYATRYGDADEAIINENHDRFSEIARELRSRYGENLTADEVRYEMSADFCRRCESAWQRRGPKPPARCPRCGSAVWQTERTGNEPGPKPKRKPAE